MKASPKTQTKMWKMLWDSRCFSQRKRREPRIFDFVRSDYAKKIGEKKDSYGYCRFLAKIEPFFSENCFLAIAVFQRPLLLAFSIPLFEANNAPRTLVVMLARDT